MSSTDEANLILNYVTLNNWYKNGRNSNKFRLFYAIIE